MFTQKKIKVNAWLLICLILQGFSAQQSFAQQSGDPSSVRIMSYNIRFNNPGDGVNAWPERKDKVFDILSSADPDVFGLQEALIGQIEDIHKAFPGYKWIGQGRDDGKNDGEFSPVFYNSSRFSLQNSGTFWLSQNPSEAGSRGWDAACNRVVSWVMLTDFQSGKSFYVFNTHFDHMGQVARRESARLILRATDSIAGSSAFIVTGDFNADPASEPIRILTEQQGVQSKLNDTRRMAAKVTGPAYSYTGFEVGAIPGELIDYIFVKNITKVDSQFINDKANGKYYPSDHLPVIVELHL